MFGDGFADFIALQSLGGDVQGGGHPLLDPQFGSPNWAAPPHS
jgi:hypothetical protein